MSENKSPLRALIGTWKGDKGIDLAPKPEVDENNPYYEVITFEAVDIDVENAGEQELLAVRYHQLVFEKANDEVSHDETGYWIWDKNENAIMVAFSIPRGVSILASGDVKSNGSDLVLSVSTTLNDPTLGIVQSPFMQQKAKTTAFKRVFKISGDTLVYSQETTVEIYNKTFAHTDNNSLKRV